MSFSPSEVHFLAEHRADIKRCAQALEFSPAHAVSNAEVFRKEFGQWGRAAAEWAEVIRKDKFPVPGWLADNESTHQATPHEVAAARAAFIAESMSSAVVHDVTCSVGSEGYALTEAGMGYVGSDLDFSRLLMASYNVPHGLFAHADALVPVSNADVIVADPARRSGGKRITKPDNLIPPLPDLVAAYAGRELAIKCAPGLDFSSWEGPVVVTSVDGGVKEACLYSRGFGPEGRREAWVLRGESRETVTNEHPAEVAAAAPGKFIIDPDGAIVRAGLVQHWAARHGLWMLDPRIAYVTGDALPPGVSGFEFIEQVPLKKLSAALKGKDVGALEILVRGVDINPDQLRKKLKLRGSNSMAVVITRIGRAGVALVCGPRTFG